MIEPLTTPAVLAAMARALPDHPALVTDDRSFTFAGLREAVRSAAAAMIALGVQAADRVAIWSPNTWHWVVAALAAHHAGAAVVPINTAFTAPEAAHILARSRARLLFAAEALQGEDRANEIDRSALPGLIRVVSMPVTPGRLSWEDFLTGPRAPIAEVDARATAVGPDDVSDIVFTSGTTGSSKGVVCAHRQSLSGAAAAAECREMSPADRYLAMAPFFHSYGFKDGVLGCLQSGATLVTVRTFDPEQIMRLIAEHRVTVLPGPPTLLQALLDHPARADYDLSSLRMCATGGSTVSVALVERALRELKVECVLTGYGLTETNGFGTACRRGDDVVTTATTCGRPLAGLEVRIDAPDDDGIGEVLLRGPTVMLGYLDDPAATSAAIDSEGWLRTGDVGSVDAAGNLRITDRLTDMYICGGLNVYPAEVEQVLTRLDAVVEAAVVGVRHPLLGEVGRAFVVRKPGAELTEGDVIAHSRGELANFKVPRSVVFCDQLPRNAGGKVRKNTLREIPYTPIVRDSVIIPRGLGGPPIGAAENWVADAWQLLLNIELPGRRDRFTDLGGDSLAAVEFSQMLQIRFGIDMSVDMLADRPTIAEIVAGLAEPEGRHRPSSVRLRDDDTGPVCLMVPGIGGHAWAFAALAAAVTTPCDMWALSLMDLRDGPADQMRDRIRSTALTTVRPQTEAGRPLVVAGYSFGAMIAADLADWLGEQGMPIAELLLLDPDPLDSAAPRWDTSMLHKTQGFFTFEPGSPAARRLAEDVNAVAEVLQHSYLDGSVRLPQAPVAWLRTLMMEREHDGSTTVFGTPISDRDTTMIDCGHLELLNIPHVRSVADWVDGRLGGVSTRATGR